MTHGHHTAHAIFDPESEEVKCNYVNLKGKRGKMQCNANLKPENLCFSGDQQGAVEQLPAGRTIQVNLKSLETVTIAKL